MPKQASEPKLHLLPVVSAVEAETGIRPNPATLWRWATKGAGGVILKTWVVGGRRMTTTAAVRQFIQDRTEQTTPSVSATRAKLNAELGI